MNGHLKDPVPDRLRDAFQAIIDVESGRIDTYDSVRDVFDGQPPGAVVWKLADCPDVMPRQLCDDLDLPQGSTFAMGAGAFFASPLISEWDDGILDARDDVRGARDYDGDDDYGGASFTRPWLERDSRPWREARNAQAEAYARAHPEEKTE